MTDEELKQPGEVGQRLDAGKDHGRAAEAPGNDSLLRQGEELNMLRFIFKRSQQDGSPFPDSERLSYETIDLSVPTVEAILRRGGYGNGHDITHLVGIEVRDESPDR